ncbi:hypothetical protein ACJMK2_041649 [Sinanodonta woodiana]|uniref:protein-tyrosine-phosphatase n=1 Tax=Sinanodonta woodiana TaxID=1069815 RepID=A0ABD3W6P1_SINWO
MLVYIFGVNLLFLLSGPVLVTGEVTCSERLFGARCQLTCHCINSNECPTDCTSGCESKWDGPTCQVVIENIALNGRAEQKSTSNERNASLAVDGRDETFGHSEWKGPGQQRVTWWFVEISQKESIRKIDIRFKGDSDDRKKIPGFSLYISDRKPDGDEYRGSHCYTRTTVDPNNTFSFRNCTRHGQFVILYNKRNQTMSESDKKVYSKYPHLQLNEVEVYGDKECSAGTYGQDCDQICGHCQGEVCNRSDGRCQCQEGWKGDTCNMSTITTAMTISARTEAEVTTASTEASVSTENNSKQDLANLTQECAVGWYGDGCNVSCSPNCSDGTRCDMKTCSVCHPGFYGDYCNLTCSTHCNISCFPNCSNGTGCDRKTGACDVCQPGFYGDYCNVTCPINCNICFPNCSDGTVCDRKTGACDVCQPGFYGDYCNLTCPTHCDIFSCSFGDTCNTSCLSNCSAGGCNQDTGYCLKCEDNWYGDTCNNSCSLYCRNVSTDSIICHEDGKCLHGCIPGMYGSYCNKTCVTKSCTECDQDTGMCKVCQKGFSLPFCNNTCPAGKYGINCNLNCPNMCQSCINGTYCTECSQGYFGNTCEDQCYNNCLTCTGRWNCTLCKEGTYLIERNQFCNACPENCTTCLNHTNCISCKDGFYGSFCQHSCPQTCLNCSGKDICISCQPGWYGPKCQCSKNCVNESSSCNTDGICKDGCKNGYYGLDCNKNCPDDHCSECNQTTGHCLVCKSQYFGSDCNKPCGNCEKNENGEILCDKETGYCGNCTNGWYGETCNKTCNVTCQTRLSTVTCEKKSGDCSGCISGYFGPKCEEKCPANCLAKMIGQKPDCDKDTGDCATCIDGYYGSNCAFSCMSYCNSSREKGVYSCNRKNGECSYCHNGRFGPMCDSLCNPNCARDDDGTVQCHKQTGYCQDGCQPGWFNETCQSRCSGTCANRLCQRQTGICLTGCSDGFEGQFCSQAVKETQKSTGGWIIIVVPALIIPCLLLLAAAGFFLWRRRHRRNEESRIDMSELTHLNDFHLYENGATSTSANSNGDRIGNSRMGIKTAGKIRRPREDTFEEDSLKNQENSPFLYEEIKPSLYYNGSTKIAVTNFFETVKERNRDDMIYNNEFESLPKGMLKSSDAALLVENRGKCRYKNIYPYDENRVVLRKEASDPYSDFINASYVNGFNAPGAFIAAQGPMDNIVDDFWRMIWQKDCGRIVMLTNLMEEGKIKCVKYWPDKEETHKYGKITVKNIKEEVFADFVVRTLKMSMNKNSQMKIVHHFHYTSWPDRDVPSDHESLLDFREKILSTESDHMGPNVIHCSAGIGRTGTLIVLDYLLKQAKVEDYIDVFKCIVEMRYQRTNFVQTQIQYEYIHEILAVAFHTQEGEVESRQLDQYHMHLQSNFRLDKQFQKLQELTDQFCEGDYWSAKLEENRAKNRCQEILPVETARPYLSMQVDGRNDYINAVFLPSYMEKKAFLLTQMPLPNTVIDFWRMVCDHNCTTIVMMNNDDPENQTYGEYLPSEGSITMEGITIEITDSMLYNGFTTSTLQVRYKNWNRENVLIVKQFCYTDWLSETAVPQNINLFLDFIFAVGKWERESNSEQRPSIIHCMDGSTRSGLYCVISTLLEKLEMEGRINLLQTILKLRSRRPSLVHNKEQLNFCYKTLVQYLDQKEQKRIYQNVYT